MPKRRRFLVWNELVASLGEAFWHAQEARFAACPSAGGYSDEEAGDFLAAALFFDLQECKEISKRLRKVNIATPPELAFDPYRLGRYFFRHWGDPGLRKAIFERAFLLDPAGLAHIRRRHAIAEVRKAMLIYGLPTAAALLRNAGMADLVAEACPTLPAEELARSEALLRFAKVQMHLWMHAPEPARQPGPWEERKLSRRLALRTVQMRAMGRSLRQLHQGRGELLRHIREVKEQENPRLRELATELQALQRQLAAEEQEHQAKIAQQEAELQGLIARKKAEVAAAAVDYSAALALRAGLLGGRTEGQS